MSRIVVGVDASEHAVRATRWAVEEARLRGAELELVYAIGQPEAMAWPDVQAMPTRDEMLRAGEDVVDETLTEVDTSGLSVTREVRAGGPAAVLCERASDADLVVVGARGLGGFKGLLLGSVTQQVVAHSPRPVVVVVPEGRDEEA